VNPRLPSGGTVGPACRGGALDPPRRGGVGGGRRGGPRAQSGGGGAVGGEGERRHLSRGIQRGRGSVRGDPLFVVWFVVCSWDEPVRVAWEKEGGGIFTKIHIQLCPAWEGLFAIFASAIDLTMDVPRWLCAFVHQLRLVHQIQSQSGSPHFGV
jgi:hypothetical protein